jgi:hypothetical protein
MNHGFIKLHRKIQEHWIYQEKRKFSRYEAWLDLLMMANHKDNKFVFGNEMVEVKKGSFITSELKLMDRWDWGKAKLRNFLELLEKDEMIIKKSDRKKTTITICNYCIYHDYETENRPQTDHEQTTNRLPADTNKNEKNEKKKDSRQKQVYDETSIYYQLALKLYEGILKNMPDKKEPNLNQWADDFRKLVEIDGKDPKHVETVIKWTQSNDFWWKNILSADKLRKQYERLAAEARAEMTKHKNVTPLGPKQLKRNDAHIEMMKKLHGG